MITPMTEILFTMATTENDLWYFDQDPDQDIYCYFRGPDGTDVQDIETVKRMIDDQYVFLKDNGRCVISKKGRNHLKKHMGVR